MEEGRVANEGGNKCDGDVMLGRGAGKAHLALIRETKE